jgi:hypothetical protein
VVLSQKVPEEEVGFPLRTPEIDDADVMCADQRHGFAYEDVTTLHTSIAAVRIPAFLDRGYDGLGRNARRYSNRDVENGLRTKAGY